VWKYRPAATISSPLRVSGVAGREVVLQPAPSASIRVSAASVPAGADLILRLKPDVVVFLNGLNDLANPGTKSLQVRVREYLRNMAVARALATRSGHFDCFCPPALPRTEEAQDSPRTQNPRFERG
jgi:hypothetical protein